MKLSLQCGNLSWSTEEKILVCFIECKSLQIYSLYIYRRFVPMLHCHKNLMLLQVIWRRRRASCLWRTTTRRTSEITRHWPWGTCCRRPGTCYVSSTDPSMSTCLGFSTRTSTCGQTDRLRNRYQTSIAWYIIPMELSVFCLCII